ncbi:c-type cytochrome [Sulfuriflexus mobilis]|uniref:c-type cytochrome n=1 Tax=Sulfuriflexus mobilis TaxID=1811807 RepID=UPI001E28B06C|nr:c-type cytochrome [Sulfuriflexus mobilis]
MMTYITWKGLSLAGLLAMLLGASSVFALEKDYQVELPAAPKGPIGFTPLSEADIPDNQFGEAVRYGKSLFVNTQKLRNKYVGNDMNCVNCHLDSGRKADSAPLWAAYTMYPAYRKKNDHVNTIEERIQGCFTYSMNGTPPPSGSKELTALVTYHYWLATGAPVGKALPGRGYPKLSKAAKEPSVGRGKKIFEANCVICHGDKGQGTKTAGVYIFPPLWGKGSFNWGAGMHRVNTAAGFIKANMPLGKPNSLTDQEAWDVAAFMNAHERPKDPRFNGNMTETASTYHKHQCFYGKKVDGALLGQGTQ